MKWKETITALATEDFFHVRKTEHEPASDARLHMVLEYTIRIVFMLCLTAFIIEADIWKLLILFAFGIVFTLFYFGTKD